MIETIEDGKKLITFESEEELILYIKNLPDKPCKDTFDKLVKFYFPKSFPWSVYIG